MMLPIFLELERCVRRYWTLLFSLLTAPSFATYGYITDAGVSAVYQVDTDLGAVTALVSTGDFSSFALPIQVVFAPDGNTVYVADSGNYLLYVIDADSSSSSYNSVTATMSFPEQFSSCLAITPDGGRLYLGQSESSGVVIVIDTSSLSIIGTVADIPTSSQPSSIAITPDGNYAYVTDANGDNNVVYVVDINPSSGTYNQEIAEIGAPEPLEGVITTDGSYLYLGGSEGDSGYIAIIDVDSSSGTWNQVIGFVTVGGSYTSLSFPSALTLSPNGETLYAMDIGNELLYTIDITGGSSASEVTQQTSVPTSTPYPFLGLAVTPDESTIYFTPFSPAYVFTISTSTYDLSALTNTVLSFADPIGIALFYPSSSPPSPGPYDLSRLREIYNTKVQQASDLLNQAGIPRTY